MAVADDERDEQGFPDGFVWGAATASYQIEGATATDGRGPSIWDVFSHTPGKTVNGETGDVAADHYRRMPQDVALLADLGVSHYRFSLAWPRLQPDGRGRLNPRGLDFYQRLVERLHRHGVEPWVTLYHWDLPQALEEEGGWPSRDLAHRFADYAAMVHERLRDTVRYWTTLNEPWCSAFVGYAEGSHAPGRTEPDAALRAAHHLMLGHGLAVRAMREQDATSRFGVTLNLYPVDAATQDAADVDAARRIDGLANRLFLDPILRGAYPRDVLADLGDRLDLSHLQDGDAQLIGAPLDLLGVNYYVRHVVRADPARRGDRWEAAAPSPWIGCADVEFVSQDLPRTAMGWEVDPGGLLDLLRRLRDEYAPPPIHITENGAAFPDVPDGDRVRDEERIDYLATHLAAAQQAVREGVDLRGYFVWSLLDNFEWAFGYTKRFGLVYVDYETQRRIPKDSFAWFADVVRRNALPADRVAVPRALKP